MSETASRLDIYERVTAKIINFLEAGASVTERLWAGGGARLPLRATNEPYRGINVVLLWISSIENGYDHPHWMTYKNAQKMGAQVRKGEKSELVCYVDQTTKPIENKDTGQMEDQPFWFWKGYSVFNASQIDGLPAAFYAKPAIKLMDKPERLIATDTFIRNTGAKVIEGGTRALYRPSIDEIHMPDFERFKDRESWASVALHELTHWTGHRDRLDRTFGRDHNSPDYAREELVAEWGAAYLCATLQITPEPREDHAAYLQAYLKLLKSEKRAVFAAASQAQKAADFLHGLQPHATNPDRPMGEEPAIAQAVRDPA